MNEKREKYFVNKTTKPSIFYRLKSKFKIWPNGHHMICCSIYLLSFWHHIFCMQIQIVWKSGSGCSIGVWMDKIEKLIHMKQQLVTYFPSVFPHFSSTVQTLLLYLCLYQILSVHYSIATSIAFPLAECLQNQVWFSFPCCAFVYCVGLCLVCSAG